MRKAQFVAIEKFEQGKSIKVIDETFDTPPSIIIYVQEQRGAPILEYLVSPSGTITLVTSYSSSQRQQEFFDKATTLREYADEEET